LTDPRPTVLLDCDPGHDDALAIAVAGLHTRLVGITTVAGNVPLHLTTRNALAIREVLKLDTPVVEGSPRPLVAEPRTAEFIHGNSGLDGPPLPPHPSQPDRRDAVAFILEQSHAHAGELWIVATGPLTNVALALRADPTLASRLAGISIMGGGVPWGNVTPAAEFNILVDPEAADIVFRSGVKLRMAGLNVTHQWPMGPDEVARVRALDGATSGFFAELLAYYGAAYARAFSGVPAGPLHDPVAVLALTHPQLLQVTPYHVVIELTGTHTRGMTVADLRGVHRAKPANTEVLTGINAAAATQVLLDTLAAYDRAPAG
jgi:inosine-uridine nucleoside N-ribohydrolase